MTRASSRTKLGSGGSDMYKLYKGIAYFKAHKDARLKAEEVGGRVVDYTRGYAVQYAKSGPYWPESGDNDGKS